MKLPRKTNTMYSALGGKIHYCRRGRRKDEPGFNGSLSVYHGQDLDRRVDRHASMSFYLRRKPVYWLGFEFSLDRYADDPSHLAAWIGPLSLYLNIDSPLMKRLADWAATTSYPGSGRYSPDREIRLCVNKRISWNVWTSGMCWDSKTPRWRNGSQDIKELLFGKWEMRWEPIETVETIIPMPERSYPATVEIRDHVSWNRRIPFLKRRIRTCNVEIPGGLGVPGKGENAWDIGADAIFSLSCPAETVAEAVGKVVESVYRDRLRRVGTVHYTEWENAS